ncbi:thioredoxin domain-containing protein [Bacteroides fragilis]|nr:thioredoxin domain-containing protein [Bacteroides fragilis]
MKKSILIPFLFMGLLAFASCKGTSENKSTTATDTVQAEKPQSGTIHLTRAEFLKKIADYENHSKEWKYLGDKPAIVDFYADWCGPCKMVAPILEELSKEYAGKIYIYKVNVDKEPELARDFWYSEYSYHLVCADERRTPGQYGSFIQGAIKRIHR